MILSAVCHSVLQGPPKIVYRRIVPCAAVAILAGIAVSTLLAKHVAERQGRGVTALSYGVSMPVMFV
jgi:AGZA family xanthine/uracil permease-like MFS transporter